MAIGSLFGMSTFGAIAITSWVPGRKMVTLARPWSINLSLYFGCILNPFVWCFVEVGHEKILGQLIVVQRNLMISKLLSAAEVIKFPMSFQWDSLLLNWAYLNASVTSSVINALQVGTSSWVCVTSSYTPSWGAARKTIFVAPSSVGWSWGFLCSDFLYSAGVLAFSRQGASSVTRARSCMEHFSYRVCPLEWVSVPSSVV